jgi:hypothetical protein
VRAPDYQAYRTPNLPISKIPVILFSRQSFLPLAITACGMMTSVDFLSKVSGSFQIRLRNKKTVDLIDP